MAAQAMKTGCESLTLTVMAGLVPAIHVDPRDKPGDDELEVGY